MNRPSRWKVDDGWGVDDRYRYTLRSPAPWYERESRRYYRRLVAYYVSEARRQAKRAREAERRWSLKLDEAQRIMRENDLKIDNLKDPMQKLAFTFYTMIAEGASEYEWALKQKREGL